MATVTDVTHNAYIYGFALNVEISDSHTIFWALT